ncbi:hypothetical protein HZB78_04755 [Candidatus Collierbacteria bacterium]|nr:hypothetical protein [Candidatus Collierbacteria bacterium]
MINFSHPNIFIGTGVATKNKLSVAIPFDSLGFLLSAEFIRQQIPGSHVFLLIADQHAWLANGISKTEVRKIASKQEKIFRQITSKFKLSNWHISKASGLFPHAIPDTYEKLETRDVSHFFHHRKTGVKIGWMFSAKENQHQTDEAHFDCNFDFNIKSIFTKPGVTLDPSKPLESPYICSNPSKRILLTKNENLTNKLDSGSTSENQRQAVQNQLKRITMLFERVVEPLPDKTSVEKKVKIILDKIFN